MTAAPEPPADVPTGAERYLAERLADPEYRAAYEAAAPEPPAPATDDDLRERIVKVIDDWHSTVEMWSELDDLADAVLAVLPAPPVPPWPGAVLSGLVDEDGQPTWLAQAGQVRGEQVRACRRDEWETCEDDPDSDVWVEVRAPRPAATERVSAFYAVLGSRRIRVAGKYVVTCNCLRVVDDGELWVGEFGTGYAVVAPDGTVEVLHEGGEP